MRYHITFTTASGYNYSMIATALKLLPFGGFKFRHESGHTMTCTSSDGVHIEVM